jgi:hypothetical protein
MRMGGEKSSVGRWQQPIEEMIGKYGCRTLRCGVRSKESRKNRESKESGEEEKAMGGEKSGGGRWQQIIKKMIANIAVGRCDVEYGVKRIERIRKVERAGRKRRQ